MKLLKFERIKKGLSLAALGRLTGVHYHTISQIEGNRVIPTQQELDALGKALGIDPSRLLIGVDATPLGDGAESRMQQRENARG